MEQLSYWCSEITFVLRDVLKSATKRIIVTNRRVIDTERGINCGCDVFRINGSLLGPTRIIDKRRVWACHSQRSSTLNTSTADQRGMDEVMIPSASARDISDSAAKFALDHDEGIVKHRSTLTSRHGGEVRYKVAQSCVELSCRRVDSTIRSINVCMVVPATQCDHDVPDAEIGRQDVARC